MLKGNKVWTPSGYQAGPVNSLVGKGESIIDYENGTGTLVTKGKVGVDNQPSSVRREDNNVIAGNDIDWSNGMKFSDQVAPLTAKLEMYNDIEKRVNKKPELSSLSKQTMELQKGQLERAKAPILQAMKNITDRQEKQHQIEDYAAQTKANRGMDRFEKGKGLWNSLKTSLKSYGKAGKGKVSGAVIDAGYLTPAMLEMSMLNHWRNESPVMPNIYAENKYAPIALQTMAGNRMSANPVLEKLYAQDRQAAYQLANSGGYTGGQRQANRTALALGNQRNVADALINVQEKNINYRNTYAQMAANLGDSDAQRQQAANQYGWEAYNRAHGQKTKGIETHLANLGLIGQKWLGQRIKNKQYGDVLDMYQQELDLQKKAIASQFGGQGGDTGTSTTGGNAGAGTTGAGAASVKTTGTGRNPKTSAEPDVMPGKASQSTPNTKLGVFSSGWTPNQYSSPFGVRGIIGNAGNFKFGDYRINKLPPTYGKYWYVDPDKLRQLSQNRINYGNQAELYQAAALGAPGYEGYIRFISDPTGKFGANGPYLLRNPQIIAGTDSQERSGMRFNKGKNRRRR